MSSMSTLPDDDQEVDDPLTVGDVDARGELRWRQSIERRGVGVDTEVPVQQSLHDAHLLGRRAAAHLRRAEEPACDCQYVSQGWRC